MLDLMVANGETLPPEIKKLHDNRGLFDAKKYQPDPVDALRSYIDVIYGNVDLKAKLFSTKGGKDALAEMKETVRSYDPRNDFQRLNKAVHEIRNQLSRSLPSHEAKMESDLWKILDDTTFFLTSLNQSINPENTTFMNNFFFTSSKAANFYQSFYNRKITEYNMAIRQEFMAYKIDYNKEIDLLAKSKNINISLASSALYKQSMKEIFSNIYVDAKHEDRNTAYTFKKLTDPSLTAADKRFLKYFTNTLQKFSDLSIFSKKVIMPGFVPLIKRTNSAFLTRRDEDETVFNNIKERTDGILSVNRKSAGKITEAPDIDAEFSVVNRFEGQLPTANSNPNKNFTFDRRRLLGIDEFGVEILNPPALNQIEDNLEGILDTFVISSLDAIYYKDAAALGRAMFYAVKRHERETGTSYSDLITTLMLIQRRVILHKSSQENATVISGINKFATVAVIAGTIPQALLETFTNPAITGANYLADKLYGVLFKGTRDFSMKSYSKAVQLVWYGSRKDKKLIEAIDRMYGFSNSDTKDLKRMMNTLSKNSLFKMEKLMYVNHLMLENWQRVTAIAYMIQDGSFYGHSVKNDGTLVYDSNKDKRFNSEGESKEKKLDKEKRYDAIKLQLSKESLGLTAAEKYEDRNLSRAYTHFDVNRIKELIVELYAGIDESAKSLASYYTWMALISKMRFWLFPKMSRWVNKPVSAEENIGISKLVRTEDDTQEGGYLYEWKGEATEGIFYSLKAMSIDVMQHGRNATITDVQARNMSKGLSDILVHSIMYLAALGLFVPDDDDDEITANAKVLLKNRVLMAADDVFFVKSMANMLTGNNAIFIGISVTHRAVMSLMDTVYTGGTFLAGGDVEAIEVVEALRETGKKSFGLYKTIDTIVSSAVDIAK
jgi:hypothetical protein